MKAPTQLTGSHLRTFDKIFQHPISHNLGWLEVHAMFRQLGTVVIEPNGHFRITRNGQSIVVYPPRTKDVSEMNEVMYLRHFLERTEEPDEETKGQEPHWLLVIDHHEARIFRAEMLGSVPQQILPHEPEDYFRHAQGSMDSARGKERPDPNSFFEPVARALQAEGPIVVLGTGTGMSSEMDQFTEWLEIHHRDVAERIIGSLTVDESHLTEGQLLATARDFYASATMV